MKLYLFLIKRNARLFVLFTSLSLWAITSSVYALSKKEVVHLIGIDEIGTRIISNDQDPILKKEVVNFLRYFTSHLYNFSHQDFITTVGSATNLMSVKLWEREKSSIKKLMKEVNEKKIDHHGVIKKITKNENSQFEIEIGVMIQEKLLKKEKILKVLIQLEPIERSESNPWGWEVVEIKESIIR